VSIGSSGEEPRAGGDEEGDPVASTIIGSTIIILFSKNAIY
jgi:hypothetical protein